MSNYLNFITILTLIASISSNPLKKDDKITFLDDDSDKFSDIIEPSELIKEKIVNVNVTSYFNDTSQIVESRFDVDVDDSADDFMINARFLIESGEIVNKRDFKSEKRQEEEEGSDARLQDGEYYQGGR